MKYNITYTAMHTGSIDVEADSADEASDLARDIGDDIICDHIEFDEPKELTVDENGRRTYHEG